MLRCLPIDESFLSVLWACFCSPVPIPLYEPRSLTIYTIRYPQQTTPIQWSSATLWDSGSTYTRVCRTLLVAPQWECGSTSRLFGRIVDPKDTQSPISLRTPFDRLHFIPSSCDLAACSFFNLRSQMWWTIKIVVEAGDIFMVETSFWKKSFQIFWNFKTATMNFGDYLMTMYIE